MSAPGNIKAGSRVEDVTIHDEGISKRDEAAIAVAEEHSLSILHVIRHNKRVVWWCFFFSMSAIGWYGLPELSEFVVNPSVVGGLMPKSMVLWFRCQHFAHNSGNCGQIFIFAL
jgi:hypothetical protein